MKHTGGFPSMDIAGLIAPRKSFLADPEEAGNESQTARKVVDFYKNFRPAVIMENLGDMGSPWSSKALNPEERLCFGPIWTPYPSRERGNSTVPVAPPTCADMTATWRSWRFWEWFFGQGTTQVRQKDPPVSAGGRKRDRCPEDSG